MGGALSSCCCNLSPRHWVQAHVRLVHAGWTSWPVASGTTAEFSAVTPFKYLYSGFPFDPLTELVARERKFLTWIRRIEGTAASLDEVGWIEEEFRIDRRSNEEVYYRYEDSYGNLYINDYPHDQPAEITAFAGEDDGPGVSSYFLLGNNESVTWSSFPYSYADDTAVTEAIGTYLGDPVFYRQTHTLLELNDVEDAIGLASETLEKFDLPTSFDGQALDQPSVGSSMVHEMTYSAVYNAGLGYVELEAQIVSTEYSGIFLSSLHEVVTVGDPLGNTFGAVSLAVFSVATIATIPTPVLIRAKVWIAPDNGPICQEEKLFPAVFDDPDYTTRLVAGGVFIQRDPIIEDLPIGDVDVFSTGSVVCYWRHEDDYTFYATWPTGCGTQ